MSQPRNSNSHDHNQSAWDRLAQAGHRFSRPASAEELANALATVDGYGWLGPCIRGQRVLCLGAGGGRQGPLYAAAGADVTVVDISPLQLERDREVAAQYGLQLRTVQSSMDQLSMFSVSWFDLVVHPVSTCYVPDVRPVFLQVARVLRPDGLYISQHKSPTSLQVAYAPDRSPGNGGVGYSIVRPYYHTGPLPFSEVDVNHRFREHGTHEFLHTLESLLGGMLRAGFVVEDFVEPYHARPGAEAGSFGHRCHHVAPYMRIKARRVGRKDDRADQGSGPTGTLWTPSP